MLITLSKPLFIQELGKRSNQEDSYFMSEATHEGSSPFFMVCDGMGGHDKGEVASALVCQSVSSFITEQMGQGRAFDDALFNDALQYAYGELDKLPVDGKRPGTTLTFLCFHRQGVTTANIGDSRIYHLRPKEGKILFQSRDHSLVFDLYLMGELSFDEMATSPQKNVITKALMPGEENHHRADMVHIGDVQPDDCFLLCSDGLLERLSNEQLLQIFSHYDDMEEVRRLLIEASDDNGDNHTAILLKVDEVEKEAGEMVSDDEYSSSFNAMNVHPMGGSQETPVAPATPVAETPESPKPSASNTSKTSNTSNTSKTPTTPKKSRKGSPVLTVVMAALLVGVLAAIGVLLFKKSPKKSSSLSQPAVEAVAPADSTALASPDTLTVSGNDAPVAAEAQAAPAEASTMTDTIHMTTAPQATPTPRTTPNPTPTPRTTPNPEPQVSAAPHTTSSPTPATSNAAQQRRDNLRDRSK